MGDRKDPPAQLVTPKGTPMTCGYDDTEKQSAANLVGDEYTGDDKTQQCYQRCALSDIAEFHQSCTIYDDTEFWSPINAMNRPIPTLIAFFMFTGIELTIASRMLNAVRMMKMIPSMNTAVSACCQE